MSQDGAGQGGGRGGTGPTEQLPVGVVEVEGVDGVDGVFLKAPQVLVEAVAAALAVEAAVVVAVVSVTVDPVAVVSVAVVSVTVVVASIEVGGWDALGNVDDVGAALPPQGGLAAGRGGRLAVGPAVAAGRRALHRGDPDGGDGLRMGMEGGREGDGGREGQIDVGRVGVEGH